MAEFTVYHNPRCSKSRQALKLLEDRDVEIEVIRYLEQPPSLSELLDIQKRLGLPATEMVRTNEAVYKERFKGADLTDYELLEVVASYPKLLQRPIVIRGNRGVIGRPPETIHELL